MSRNKKIGFLLLLPAIIYIILTAIYPIIYSVYLSFFEYRLTDPTQTKTFVGLYNYLKAIKSHDFRIIFKNTLVFVFFTVSIQLILGYLLAAALNKENKIINFIRTIIIIPMAITPIVIGLVWKNLYNADYGWINYLVQQLNFISVRGSMLSDSSTAMGAVILIDIWRWTPLIMLMLLAGLKSIDKQYYEAARIDGASMFQRFKYVTFPLLKPVILVALIIRTLDAFKVFDIIWASTQGGPGLATEVLNFHIYKEGLDHFRMGAGTAKSNMLVLIMIFITIFYIRILESQED